jgi:uncharacterized membrane-anchored protein
MAVEVAASMTHSASPPYVSLGCEVMYDSNLNLKHRDAEPTSVYCKLALGTHLMHVGDSMALSRNFTRNEIQFDLPAQRHR